MVGNEAERDAAQLVECPAEHTGPDQQRHTKRDFGGDKAIAQAVASGYGSGLQMKCAD